ncbi:ABC transporter permease [Halanaerobium salsuginis]|uniref:Peptide/nickel transport system permease protein n=1 Tax=Halanaerobium salsuginis TaxID=29563 RepID=A0A1I4LED5_9FIRM|nr:ABC transporter permease [Halanaerobium salsuginis]SFL89428.1 peptide/nickel transport system permease protein [Halanaerobium salsuginis]
MREFCYRFYKNKLAFLGFIILFIFLVMAIFAPYLAPYDPFQMDPQAMLQPPGADHLFGTDQFGRDILSRIIFGSRISFKVGLISVGLSLIVGVSMGIVAGYYGGWLDNLISRIMDVMFSFPQIFLALVIMAVLGTSSTNLMLAIGLVYIPIFGRIARASVLSIKDSLYIEAANSIGVSNLIIMLRHILPNIMAPIIVQTTLSFGFAIRAEAALSFLGLGVEADIPSWGIMLNQGKDWMEMAWWNAVFPGLSATLAILSFNILGDGLRDALDPRLRNEGE